MIPEHILRRRVAALAASGLPLDIAEGIVYEHESRKISRINRKVKFKWVHGCRSTY